MMLVEIIMVEHDWQNVNLCSPLIKGTVLLRLILISVSFYYSWDAIAAYPTSRITKQLLVLGGGMGKNRILVILGRHCQVWQTPHTHFCLTFQSNQTSCRRFISGLSSL